MTDDTARESPRTEEIPLMQRLYDSPFLVLAACILVMFGFFTIWGLVEIATLEPAPLP